MTTSELQGESISFGFPVTYTPAKTGVAGRLEGDLFLANAPHRGTVFSRGCLEELKRGADEGIPLTGLAGELLATVRGPDLVLTPNSVSVALELPAAARGSLTDRALRGEGAAAPTPLSLYVEYLLLAKPTPLYGPVSRRVQSIRPIRFWLGAPPPTPPAEPKRRDQPRAPDRKAGFAGVVLQAPPGIASVVRPYAGGYLVFEPGELVSVPAEQIAAYQSAGFPPVDPASLAPAALAQARRQSGRSTILSLTTRAPAEFRPAAELGGGLGQVTGLVVEYERLDRTGAAFARGSVALEPSSPTTVRLTQERIPLVDAAGSLVGVVRQLKAQRVGVWAAADLVEGGAARLLEQAFAQAGSRRDAELAFAARVVVRDQHSEARPGGPPVPVYDQVELVEVAVRPLFEASI